MCSSIDSTWPPWACAGEGAGAAGRAGGGGACGGAAAAGAGAGAGGAGWTSGAGGGAAVAAGAGAEAACSPASPMTATTVLIGTVWPSLTLISVSVPATGEGISASTLSVEISKIGSSRLTVSPTFLSHLVMVPSAMDSPIWGMMTEVDMNATSQPTA